MNEKVVIGTFAYVDDIVKAIKQLKAQGLNFEVFSPVPSHDIEHALEEHREGSFLNFSLSSVIAAVKNRDFHVMRITAAGSIATAFFLMGLGFITFVLYPIQSGGLPIIPLPALGLVGGIGSALGGVIFSVVGFLFLARLPSLNIDNTYNPAVSNDRFTIVLKGQTYEEMASVKKILNKCGAEEIKEEEDGRVDE